MSAEIIRLREKVKKYKKILDNTSKYRKAWESELKTMIIETLESIAEEIDLDASVEVRDALENLEIVVFSLGRIKSGIAERVDEDVLKPMIKNNGALIYQQLFNGKVLIMISLPFIEGTGEPRPPKTIEILRPEELKRPFIFRHVEQSLSDVTEWEDYDDDAPQQKSGFNPIGFNIIRDEDGEPIEE